MNTHYPDFKRVPDANKDKLIREIDATQSGNDSSFKEKLSEYKVSLSRLAEHTKLVSGVSAR